MRKLFKSLLGWFMSLGLAFLAAILISLFVIQPSKILGHSMDPSLHDQQYVIVSKLIHTLGEIPDYGEIVIIDSRVDLKRTFLDDLLDNSILQVFQNGETREKYIKRVIGKPGDLIEFRNSQVYRNGILLEEPYIKNETWNPVDEVFYVPPGHIFVLGDNRNHSKDSRQMGCIPLSHVLGTKM